MGAADKAEKFWLTPEKSQNNEHKLKRYFKFTETSFIREN